MEYKVIREIKVLHEFSSDILSEIYRLKKQIVEADGEMLTKLEEQVANIFRDIFQIETFEDTLIIRGKLQMAHKILNGLSAKLN